MFWRRKKQAPSSPPESRPASGASPEPAAPDPGDFDELSDTLMIARDAQDGDSGAWLALDARLRPWMAHQLSRQHLPRGIDADDVIQEVMLYVHRRFDQFKVQPEAKFRAWLRKILKNKLIDLHRRRTTQKKGGGKEELLEDREHFEPAARAADRPSVNLRLHEIQEHLEDVDARLHPRHRMVLELREEQELSFAEIARRMGYTQESSVRVLLRRARLERRKLLAEFDENEEESS